MSKLLITVIFIFSLFISSKGQPLNYYYGNIHSHTAYSDGNKELNILYDCPAESYAYAKKSLNFDFLGISEHNHAGAGMSLPRYADGLSEANIANVDGSFVAMYGMEWGVISQGGHVILYGSDKLIGWETGNYDVYNAISDYDELFKKIARYPGGNAFAYLAHPNDSDYAILLRKPLNLINDSAIVGMAIRSGPAMSTDTNYSNPSGGSYETRYKEALSLGYHLGAGLDHDNHYTTFGRTAKSRMVLLAPSLTKNNIISSIKSMKMYSSDDWNIKVNFTVNGQPLGSIFSSSGTPTISVSVTDDITDTISYIRVYYGIPGSGVLATLLTSNTNSTTLSFTHNIANNTTYYYYVVIMQKDNQKVFTSPIWYTRNDVVLPIELLSFNAEQKGDFVNLKWETASETNNDYFTIESSLNGFDFEPIGNIAGAGNSNSLKSYVLSDKTTSMQVTNGIIYYRLKQTNYDKEFRYSSIISIDFNSLNLAANVSVFPIPANSLLSVSLFSKIETTLYFTITDKIGQEIYKTQQNIKKGDNKIVLTLPTINNDIYFLKGNNAVNSIYFSKTIAVYNP